MSTIILGVTGSIAAYKAADLASKLTQSQHEVHCLMTKSATEFIPPLTLQILSRNSVLVSFEDEKQSWKPGHIELADNADLLVVAPASANTIGNFAQGLAPDLLSSLYLATKVAVLIAPAMNGKMWNHPATQNNVEILKSRGCHFLGPQENGLLACGYEGEGRLVEIKDILDWIEQFFKDKQ